MKKKILEFASISALLALFIIGGCNLITGTFVIDIDVENTNIIPHDTFEYFAVDLTTNDTWKNHKDNIKNVDNIGFQLWVTNNGTDSVGWEFYADTTTVPHTDIPSIKAHAKQVLAGLTLPPGAKYIDWPTSLIYLNSKELPTFKQWVETGKFDIYALTNVLPYNVTIDSAKVIITVTAGP